MYYPVFKIRFTVFYSILRLFKYVYRTYWSESENDVTAKRWEQVKRDLNDWKRGSALDFKFLLFLLAINFWLTTALLSTYQKQFSALEEKVFNIFYTWCERVAIFKNVLLLAFYLDPPRTPSHEPRKKNTAYVLSYMVHQVDSSESKHLFYNLSKIFPWQNIIVLHR